MVKRKRPVKEDDFGDLDEMEELEKELESEPEEPEDSPDVETEPELESEPEPEPEVREEPKGRIAMEAASDVDVQLLAVMGKQKFTMKDLIELRMGSVIDLKRPPNEMVDLVANGRLIARGELVEIDGKLGVKILKMVR